MRWLVGCSLRFRYLVVGLAAGLMFFGVQVLGHEKLDVFPEFAPVSVEIQTTCLGLSPEQVESLTTVPLEAALQGVPGVDDVQSYSEPELSAIYLYFRSGTSQLHARQLVQERLRTTAPTLPTWCDPPQMYPIVSATSRVMQIGFTSTTLSPLELSTVAQWTIRPKLMGVPGVANAAIWGVNPRQIMVEGDPARMRTHGITLDELMATAADSVDAGELGFTTGSAVGALGFTETPAQRLDVANIQPIQTPSQMAQVPLETGNGKLITIGQVATVAWGYPTPTGDALVDGGHGLMMVVEKFPGANTLQVTRGVEAALAALAPGLHGVHVDSGIFRQAAFIQTAIGNLGLSVILGCILVVFVLLAFLFQGRAALVSLLAIPLSLVTAAVVLELAGSTINTMVLAGFAVAVGVVVDDAIIDMENILRRLRAWRVQGKPVTPLRLVLAASLEVRVAIFYATLINIVAVVPVMLVGGLTGAFFEPLALAYGLAVLASMLVALTVTPALGLILLGGARLAPADPPPMRVLKRGYAWALRLALRLPWLAFAAVPVAIAAAVVVYPRIGQDLFPDFKEPDFLVHFVTKPDTSLPDMDREVAQLQRELLAIPGVADVGSHIGTAPLGEEINGVNFSESWLSLSPGADYPKVLAQVRAVAAGHPGAFSDVQTYLHERIDEVLTDGTTDDVVVRVYGSDVEPARCAGQPARCGPGPGARADRRPPGRAGVHPPGRRPGQPGRSPPLRADAGGDQARGRDHDGQRADVGDLLRRGAHHGRGLEHPGYPAEPGQPPAAPDRHPQRRARRPRRGGLGHRAAVPQPGAAGKRPALHRGGRQPRRPRPGLGDQRGQVGAGAVPLPGRLPVRAAGGGDRARRRAAAAADPGAGRGADHPVAAAGRLRHLAAVVPAVPDPARGAGRRGARGVGRAGHDHPGRAGRLLHRARHRRPQRHPADQPLPSSGAGRGGPVRAGACAPRRHERLSPIMMTALATALALVPLVLGGNRPGQEIEYPMAIVILGGLATSTLLNLFVLPVLYLSVGRSRPRPRPDPDPGDHPV